MLEAGFGFGSAMALHLKSQIAASVGAGKPILVQLAKLLPSAATAQNREA